METLSDKITRLANLREARDQLSREAGELEMEIVQEMEAQGATEVLHPDYKVQIPTRRQYDPDKVRAKLGEVLPPDWFDELYQPEREETVTRTVPAKVDGRLAAKLLKTEYAGVLEECMLPQERRLKLEPKEAK